MARSNCFREVSPLKLYAVSVLLPLVWLVLIVKTAGAASRPTTVAEIALYQGSDREQILIEGAKREGQMMFYVSNS